MGITVVFDTTAPLNQDAVIDNSSTRQHADAATPPTASIVKAPLCSYPATSPQRPQPHTARLHSPHAPLYIPTVSHTSSLCITMEPLRSIIPSNHVTMCCSMMCCTLRKTIAMVAATALTLQHHTSQSHHPLVYCCHNALPLYGVSFTYRRTVHHSP